MLSQLNIKDAIYILQFDGHGGANKLSSKQMIDAEHPVWLHMDYASSLSHQWLQTTSLIPALFKAALAGESQRPRMTRADNGILLTLRTVNLVNVLKPDNLVTICIYLNDTLIVSTQNQHLYGIDEIHENLHNKTGPHNTAQWIVQLAEILTDHAHEYIEDLHDHIIELENSLLAQKIPKQGRLALLRKQLIIMRRHMSPQRDLFVRLVTEPLPWINDIERQRLRDIADRLGRGLDDLDAGISRTTVLADEITTVMAHNLNRRIYIMSLLTMLFLPMTFLTGLLGVNLGGIPGNQSPYGFILFIFLLCIAFVSIIWWIKRYHWLSHGNKP